MTDFDSDFINDADRPLDSMGACPTCGKAPHVFPRPARVRESGPLPTLDAILAQMEADLARIKRFLHMEEDER